MPVTVEDLINQPFLSRTVEHRLKIISDGKPRPDLNMSVVVTMNSETSNGALTTHQFRQAMYDDVKWLTGCDKRQTFFCWPCLLFMPSSGLWNTTGVGDLVYYLEAMPKHEESFEHMQAMLKMQNLIEINAKTENNDKKQHNDMVKRNRAILKRLMDVVCNIIVKEKHYEERPNNCRLDPERVVKNLQFLVNYDVLNCNFIEDAIDMIDISPDLINDLVDTVTKKIRMVIHKEIQDSSYVSLILSDHSKYGEKPQISTILRYLKGDKVCERFIGFTNLCDGKDKNTILEHIKIIVQEFSISDKFNSFSLDGGIMAVDELTEFVYYVMKESYPHTYFVPWHGHNLDCVLEQSLEAMNECQKFFKSMKGLRNYFHKKSDRNKRLEKHINSVYPDIKTNKWFGQSEYINILKIYRKYFISFLDAVVQNSTVWEPNDVVEAMGFKLILEDFNTIFLLETLFEVFQAVAPLNKILKSSTPDQIFYSKMVDEVRRSLTELRSDKKFEEVWCKANDPRKLPENQPAKRIKTDPEYRTTFCLIIDRVLEEINVRLLHSGQLSFCQLVRCNESGQFTSTNDRIQAFISAHSETFEEEQIRNELVVLRTNTNVFAKKSLHEMLVFFRKTKLNSTFKFLNKLVEYILTLSVSTEADSRKKLKSVEDWSYAPEATGAQRGDISISCIEEDLLQDLKKSSFFHEEIAVIFYNVNNSFELLFK